MKEHRPNTKSVPFLATFLFHIMTEKEDERLLPYFISAQFMNWWHWPIKYPTQLFFRDAVVCFGCWLTKLEWYKHQWADLCSFQLILCCFVFTALTEKFHMFGGIWCCVATKCSFIFAVIFDLTAEYSQGLNSFDRDYALAVPSLWGVFICYIILQS